MVNPLPRVGKATWTPAWCLSSAANRTRRPGHDLRGDRCGLLPAPQVLRSGLSGLFGSATAASDAIQAAGLDPTARGEALSVEHFAAIAVQLG